ncbi:hypothetical protein BDW69DRAFT_188918 [Aspergillus filifer]
MAGAETQSSEISTPNKRRKIRKGTTSCWECKRRKVRCSLVDHPDRACTACYRRGKQCVTQDLPDRPDDPDALPAPGAVSEPRGSVPSPTRATNTCYPDTHTDTHTNTDTDTRITLDLSAPAVRPIQTSHSQPAISQELYSNLPCKEEIDVLSKVVAHVPITFHSFMTIPYPHIEKHGVNETASLLDMPTSETHPVILAKYLLRACMILQSLDFSKSGKELTALSVAPQLLTRQLAEPAIRLVTSRDELLGSIEGIECVLMEGSYQANCGNFRPAWIAFRKAMSLAQVIGIHRSDHGQVRFIDPSRKVNTSFLWHRIVYIDRFMCLMMGLPQGSMDRTMAAKRYLDAGTPMGRLERLHCVIASRILERNDTGSASSDDIRKIDRDLQTAADAMPSEWWAVPDSIGLASITDNHNQTVDWTILRLVTQLYHYGLVNQLHLPFMLRFTETKQPELHNYSQGACVNASREILARYIALRSSTRVAHSCRVVEFFTLSSALLLMVAHLREHARTPSELAFNPLAHQRQGDRAMVSQAVQNLQKIAWISQDRIIANSADLLSRLLDIEAEAAKGRPYTTRSIGTPDEVAQETENGPPPINKGLRFCIPYFGFVRITPQGPLSKEATQSSGAIVSSLPTPDSTRTATYPRQIEIQNIQLATVEPGVESEVHPWYTYPGSIGADDWAIQGLDMTFFDCLFQTPTPLGDNGAYSDPRPSHEIESNVAWDQKGDVDFLRERYKNWHPLIRVLTNATPYTNLYPNFAGDAIPTWVFNSRVTLAGDAAHAHGGAFAANGSLALDDAFALRLAFENILRSGIPAASKGCFEVEGIEKALRLYERRRRLHAERMLSIVHGQLDAGKIKLAATEEEENERLIKRMRSRVDTAWLSEHDVEAAFGVVVAAAGTSEGAAERSKL